MDLTRYKFEMFVGLPPDGERHQFLGFDKNGYAFVLRWHERSGCWAAVGIDPRYSLEHLAPLVMLLREENVGRIVSWSAAPVPWPETDKPAAAEVDDGKAGH